jgi:alpha-1,6-mannosyltransferase
VSRRVVLKITGEARGGPDGPDGRGGRGALGLIGLSLALVMLTGSLGPSAATLPLPQRNPAAPPYWLDVHPSPWLVSGLLLAALLAGAAGLLLGLRAIGDGWAPDPSRLLGAGAIAAATLVLVPPMGSADVLVYAAYGRLAATGGSPYTDTARTLADAGDPIGRAVEAPWTDVPSVYGPIATAEQWLAAVLGGGSTHATVFWLAAFGAFAFVVTGLFLQRLVGPEGRVRAALLWSLNPLLLYEVVGGAHIDGLAVVFAAGALLALRRSPPLAGVLAGCACAVKLTFGLYVLALVWALRRDRRGLATMLAGGLVVGAATYAPIGAAVLDQVRAASRFVSFATPWRLLVGPLESVLPADLARTLISLAAWVAFAALAVVLARELSGPEVGGATGEPDNGAARAGEAVRAAAVLTVAWLLTAPYSLPWYDAIAWAPLAALPASGLDRVLVARTTVMGMAYVPGRVLALPQALDFITRHLRGAAAPVLNLGILVAAFRTSGTPRTPTPTPPAAPQPPARRPAR